MSKVSKAVIDLIDAIQSRLSRVQQQTHANTNSVLETATQVRAAKSVLSELVNKQTTLITHADNLGLKVAVHSDKIVKLESRDETLLARIKEVAFENDKREEQQVLRDQSNVKSLKDLRDLTQKAFDRVAEDVKKLMESTQRLNERVGKIESLVNVGNAAFQQMVGVERRVGEIETRLNSAAPAAQMPSDHVWVNKKLTGVYDSITELEERLQLLEESNVAPVNFYGYTVSAQGPRLVLDGVNKNGEVFSLPDKIANLVLEPYGLIITLKNGDKYILCGGPTPATMFVNVYQRKQ